MRWCNDDAPADSCQTGVSRAQPRPGILLDRDGTIIVDYGYVGSVDRVEIIDGSAAAIASFSRTGVPVVVVRNQAGLGNLLDGSETRYRRWNSTSARRYQSQIHPARMRVRQLWAESPWPMERYEFCG